MRCARIRTRADLAWLHAHGWPEKIHRHLRYGGKVIGVCGGFQMLGTRVVDALGVEGVAGESCGLGLLAMETDMTAEKRLEQVRGMCAFDPAGAAVSGYEIHMGVSRGPALERPAFVIGNRPEGACSADGQVLGTYLHGLFDTPAACKALLQWAGLGSDHTVDTAALREASLDRIADASQPLLDALTKLAAPDAALPTIGLRLAATP